MSAPSFTPGPWEVHEEGTKGGWRTEIQSERGDIARVWRSFTKPPNEGYAAQREAAANARLIAAAPAMYAALEGLLEYFMLDGDVSVLAPGAQVVVKAASAALKAARGEA